MESCIWNPKDANHKDKKKQADAWIRLAQLTGRPVKEVKNKKEILMTTFRKHLKKKQESIRSGAGMFLRCTFIIILVVCLARCNFTLIIVSFSIIPQLSRSNFRRFQRFEKINCDNKKTLC